jgi:hypothetical protein
MRTSLAARFLPCCDGTASRTTGVIHMMKFTLGRASLGALGRAAILLWLAEFLVAQYPLTPTINTTIVVPPGALHYSVIHIPAGVTVRFVAPGFGPSSIPGMPAVIRCDGDAIIHGSISMTQVLSNDHPAGWVTTGQGSLGIKCGNLLVLAPGGGRHNYGSLLPFTLEGGSKGGVFTAWTSGCAQSVTSYDGGKGGGALGV